MKLFPSVSDLSREGFLALDRGQWEKALRLARKLTEKRNTAGREIAARALWELGKPDEAMEELRAGIATAPQIYIFYSLLGHYLSDLGRYDEALEAFYRGKLLTVAPMGEFEYNIGIVKGRQGDYAGALEAVEPINLSNVQLQRDAVQFSLAFWLIGADRCEEGLAEAEAGLQLPRDECGEKNIAGLHAMRAWAWQKLGRPASEVREEALKAIATSKSQSDAAWIIRELDNAFSPEARRAKVTVQGICPARIRLRKYRFVAVYWVVATHENQLLGLIRPFEPEEHQDTLELASVEWQEEAPDSPMGVYEAHEAYFLAPLRQFGRKG